MNSNSLKQNGNEDGMTYGNLIISIVFSIVLIGTISFFMLLMQRKDSEFFQMMHKQETQEAYRFTWVKNIANQLQNDCKTEKSKNERTVTWLSQNHPSVKLSSELLSESGKCVIVEQMPEFKETTEDK